MVPVTDCPLQVAGLITIDGGGCSAWISGRSAGTWPVGSNGRRALGRLAALPEVSGRAPWRTPYVLYLPSVTLSLWVQYQLSDLSELSILNYYPAAHRFASGLFRSKSLFVHPMPYGPDQQIFKLEKAYLLLLHIETKVFPVMDVCAVYPGTVAAPQMSMCSLRMPC